MRSLAKRAIVEPTGDRGAIHDDGLRLTRANRMSDISSNACSNSAAVRNASIESMEETANLLPRLVPWWAIYPATPTLRHAQLYLTQKQLLKTPSYATQSLSL